MKFVGQIRLPAVLGLVLLAGSAIAQMPVVVPPPIPAAGTYALNCSFLYADLTSENLKGKYSLGRGFQRISFQGDGKRFSLSDPFDIKIYSRTTPPEAGIKLENYWLNIQFDSLIPITSKAFQFTIYKESEGPGHLGRDMNSLYATAICLRVGTGDAS